MEVQQPELKKKQSSRREGEVEVDSLVERTQGTAATGGRGQAGKAAVGGPHEAAACALDGPIFTCR